ncbi:hypothetical protein AALC17_16840 [Oscillospiraceae bacterium 38-13]
MKVYVALLEKIGALRSGCFEECLTPTENRETWITLGHFDAMHTYELNLENQNLFQAIHQNNARISTIQRDDRYFYSLYLLSPEDNDFLCEKNTPFLAIAKLHFAESVNINQAYSDLLKDLDDHAKKYDCAYRAFRTIELSDMILAVTANRLDMLLNFTLTLRVYPNVGKVYTYVGISYQAVKEQKWLPDEEDQIEMFSMRFSVKDFRPIKSTVRQIVEILGREPGYSVSGVDDIAVNWPNLESKRLVNLYRNYFLEQKSLPWDQCFAEVTSRVGVSLRNVNSIGGRKREGEAERDSREPTKLQKKCDALLLLCGRIREKIREQEETYNWSEPLFQLVNTLARISRTAVLDEFVYIMYAGVDAFLRNVEYRLRRINEEDLSQYQVFVEDWAHLMEHIIRIEGQLAHNPELRPILYDIPVAMLEYTLSFLKEITDALQAADEPNQAEICFLLVPRLCNRIKAEELFPARANDGLPGLVLVTIPVQSLYDARTVQRALCHEVSHFAGENCRGRDDRKRKYVQSSSALMSKVFFGDVYPAFIEGIQDRLMRELSGISWLGMNVMRRVVWRWADDLVDNQETYFDFIWSVLQKSSPSNPPKLNPNDTKLNQIKKAHFSDLLRDLSFLYREIYADICMLHLLPVSETEHIESLIQELATEKRVENRRYEAFAVRIYVSLVASRRNIPWEHIKKSDENLYWEMQEIQQCLSADVEPRERLFPLTSIYFLLRYAEGCFDRLCRQPQESLQKVWKMFHNVISPDFNYEIFLEDINQYRLRLLGDK